MNNKVALITGSSKGIGKATVISLASKGFDIIINYNTDFKGANETEKYIQKEYKVKTMVIKCDISNEEEVEKMVNTIIVKFSKIDVLVNNAGISIDTLFADKSVSDFKKVLDTNVIGTFLVSKYVGKYMIMQKKGKIINVSSTNGIDTYYPEGIDYDASKAAIISLTHNLAKEYAPYINVNAIAPGWVNTDMNKNLDGKFVNDENKKIYLNRFAEPYEIANLITFLASDEASYINNSIIRIDGGYNGE